MAAHKHLTWSLGEVVAELGGEPSPVEQAGIVALVADDRLFIGNGCEALTEPGSMIQGRAGAARAFARHEERALQNVSVCVHGPVGWTIKRRREPT